MAAADVLLAKAFIGVGLRTDWEWGESETVSSVPCSWSIAVADGSVANGTVEMINCASSLVICFV